MLFTGIQKKLAIRNYRKKLGKYLVKLYGWNVTYIPGHGWRPNYTPEQVKSGAHDLGLSTDGLCLAYAMYCTPADFDAHHTAIGESCDYDAMYTEVVNAGGGYHEGCFDSAQGDHQGGFLDGLLDLFDSGHGGGDGDHSSHDGGWFGGSHGSDHGGHHGGYDGGFDGGHGDY